MKKQEVVRMPESITFHSKEELYRMLDEGLEAVQQGHVKPIEEVFPEIKRRLLRRQ
ncbi:hypothetical protein [Desulfitobacterium hafniense]|uniref:hypothetical protein n=1 Tax=Desulfitobacterium hafniense TaxID=49338 RepID=UPI00036264B7|nr:hypothetical protein [Desulfitobacterium hafniense]